MTDFDQFKTIESTQAFLAWLPEEYKKNILQVLKNQDEVKKAKESTEKLPELEKKNFKIDLGLSSNQRESFGLSLGIHTKHSESLKIWKSITLSDGSVMSMEKDSNGVVYLQKDLTPEESDKNKKAYIREMISGVDDIYIYEQKFNLAAVDRLWLRNRIIKNYYEFSKIKWDMSDMSFVDKYFSKNENPLLSGFWHPDTKEFCYINERESCWLWNGCSLEIGRNAISHNDCHPLYGYSVRTVKGR